MMSSPTVEIAVASATLEAGITEPEAEARPALNSVAESALLTFNLPRYQVLVRRLLESDVLALEWHGGADLRSFYEWQWEQHSLGKVCVLVADFNGFPIGQSGIHWHGKPTHPHIPDIQSVRVLPIFRGLGIGSQLLRTCENVVAEQGHPQVSLSVGVENEPARRLYERLGYRITGEPYRDLWNYTDAQGQVVHVEELVADMLKTLNHPAGQGA